MRTKIRPAARLLQTIGRDLIKDQYAAIVELVKNAYDADSDSVSVKLEFDELKKLLSIIIIDHGDGMDYDTVVGKWMVPATDDKLKRKTSHRGRTLQGRKGIGRFSAAILGDIINLETTKNGETTSLILDMEALNKVDFLDEYEIDIDRNPSSSSNGTIIEVEKNNISKEELLSLWGVDTLKKLQHELRSLISPEEVYPSTQGGKHSFQNDRFEIKLSFKDFPINDTETRNTEISLSPYPILELYDYRIYGSVDSSGKATLNYVNQNIPELPVEKFDLKILTDGKYPGPLYIDLMGFDRDPSSINNLIKRGLKDPDTGEYIGKRDAREILNDIYGIGIYRRQFRIRPYGDQAFDWLELDKKRVQSPSSKLGHNQVVGFIFIQPEEESHLTEKSARDGLVENSYYDGLKDIVDHLMIQLEVRRKRYRDKTLQGGRHRTIEQEVDLLFDFSGMQSELSSALTGLDIPRNSILDVEKSISLVIEKEQRKKSAYAEKIKETLATYQNHAVLGRLTHVLIHEGRKHIKDLTETVPRIIKWAKELSLKPNDEMSERLMDRSQQVKSSTGALSYLFKKIEPLAHPKRTKPKQINLKKLIESSLDIFQADLKEHDITATITSAGDFSLLANEIDLMTIFTNLVENSIFWLTISNIVSKEVNIDLSNNDNDIVVTYTDSGPGFQGDNLNLMFEPGYSTKPKGTGLGLALAGEAALRSNGEIRAISTKKGAEFLITFAKGMVAHGNA
ncbi:MULTISPECIES: sensor histidine kinase [Cycloclasticus]|uniref:histidine kinase n=1 Tax=Cycloclasticus pugetii TaxID=34068 RepID=A0AB33Z5U5_9GAMM|nr:MULTISPECIES: sensor histidine kinase [Cycloclasticus]ATI03798.1 ATP-binding protein [Cycloclasticus sp. PY97N]EPD14227.1 hypothetical protein L196_01980 [Cycloclasticus pugetii]